LDYDCASMLARSLAVAALAALLSSCASRPTLCARAGDCGSGRECVAGACEGDALSLTGTRRLVFTPAAIAVVERTSSAAAGAIPAVLVLGRADHPAKLLLRFDLRLDPGATVARASILLDRSDALGSDPSALRLHAERVIGAWNPETVSWATAPPVEDIGSPRTVVRAGSSGLVRVDVTALVRRWIARDRADRGVVVVAENEVPSSEAFTLAPTSEPPRQPPRLEVYLR